MYKKLKHSCELSDMERQLGKSMGYKKLSKDHVVRNSVLKKSYKSANEEKSRPGHKSSRNENLLNRSASVSMLKHSNQGGTVKSTKKKAAQDGVTTKSQKSSTKLKTKMPKKSTSECQAFTPTLDERGHIEERLEAAGEGYRKNASKTSVGKFLFVSEDKESTELHLHKEYIKTAILQSDLSNADLEEIIRKKNLMMLQSPRNKSSTHIEEVKQPSKKLEHKPAKHKSALKKKVTPKLGTRNAVDESTENGMSYLMKRYLEASNEVARKFSEYDRETKNSGTQVDLPQSDRSDQPQRKSLQSRRIGLPQGPAINRPVSRNFATNVFARLSTLKRTSQS